jgi:aspartyl-tRNA(Asn)/glutamyl-tRNA(Gln) amidotransferase subunit A
MSPLSSTAPMKSIEFCSHGAAGNIWLPVGLMIAGPHFSKGKILALARAYELETKWNCTGRP